MARGSYLRKSFSVSPLYVLKPEFYPIAMIHTLTWTNVKNGQTLISLLLLYILKMYSQARSILEKFSWGLSLSCKTGRSKLRHHVSCYLA